MTADPKIGYTGPTINFPDSTLTPEKFRKTVDGACELLERSKLFTTLGVDIGASGSGFQNHWLTGLDQLMPTPIFESPYVPIVMHPQDAAKLRSDIP